METEPTLEDIKQESDTRLAFYKDPLALVLRMYLMGRKYMQRHPVGSHKIYS